MTGRLRELADRASDFRRRIGARAFRDGRALWRRLKPASGTKADSRVAVLLPSDGTRSELGDALNRVAWYLGGRAGSGEPVPSVSVFLPEGLTDLDLPAEAKAPREQRDYLDRLPPVSLHPRRTLDPGSFDHLLVLRVGDLAHLPVFSHLERVYLVDERFYGGLSVTEYARLAARLQPEAVDSRLASVSRENLKRLRARTADRRRAMVLGTGPSVEEVFEMELKDTATVVCNSIVKNRRLLDHLRPAAVCFGDPVFHFGPSEYAGTFRDDLIGMVEDHDCFAVTHRREAGLLLQHFPDLRERLIALDATAADWRVPSPSDLTVRPTQNILTLFMLPLATYLSDRVAVGGCDGRDEDETYFWKHNESVQYEGLMSTVAQTHPSFFRDRRYADYYAMHCRELESQLAAFEAHGTTFETVTHSRIPALVRRMPARSGTG